MGNATWTGAIDEVEVLKSTLAPTAAKGSDFFNFSCREQSRKFYAPKLFGPAVTTVMAENGRCKYMLYDMLGRSGRANHPTAQHFYPEIKTEFAKGGITASELPPAVHEWSAQEPIHARLQREVKMLEDPNCPRPDPTQSRRRLIGPQTFYDAQRAVSDTLYRWRTTICADGRTLMQKYCAAGYMYKQISNGKELDKLWASSEVYQTVKRLRAETPRGTPFNVPYNGKIVECKNLAVKLKPITAEGRLSLTNTRCMWLPSTGANAPARIPEPPQQPVHQLGPDDDEYWE